MGTAGSTTNIYSGVGRTRTHRCGNRDPYAGDRRAAARLVSGALQPQYVVEEGGFLYNADSYADDLPYWVTVRTTHGPVQHLVVPYSLDTNDMRFAAPQGFNSGDQFFAYLRDAFDVLYAEGDPRGLDAPKMLSIGLHARIIGRPARLASLARFLDHVRARPDVWIARRIDIARHWQAAHPASTSA